MQQVKSRPVSGRRYRFFADPGHGWLEVPHSEVVASGAKISACSYYDPVTDMAYLEEDGDLLSLLKASRWAIHDVRAAARSAVPESAGYVRAKT